MKSEQKWEKELHDILEKLRNNSVNEIDLRIHELDANGAKVLAEALKENHSLTTMGLGENNNIGAEGAKALAEVLKENGSLTEMFLVDSDIGDEGAAALADALKVNSSLEKMYLSSSKIGDDGTAALAEALKVNRSLTTINLDHANIGDEGTVALAKALKENHSLTEMALGWNNIGDEGAVALAEALKVNRSLREMALNSNNIGAQGVSALTEALKENHSVEKINLAWNKIGDDGTAALAEALKVNHSLTTMNLSFNNIGAEGVIALAEALKENYSLTTIGLRSINSDTEEHEVIQQLVGNMLLRNQLHQAVQAGDLEKTQEYIHFGARLLSVTGKEKNTPLHWAAAKGHSDIVKLLLVKMGKQKLNLAIQNKKNQTPLDLARKNDHQEIIKLLQEAIAKQEATHSERHIQRGEKFLADEEYSEALQCFEEALKLQPEHVEALLRKGIVLQKLTRLDEAKQIFEKITAIEDKNDEKYQQLAKQHLQKIEKKQTLLQQQGTVAPPAQTANISALIPNNTEREGLLERASSKNVFHRSKIQPNLAGKQTTPAVLSYSLSQNRAKIQFSPTARQQTDALKQFKPDSMPEASEDVAKEKTITKRN